MLGGRAGGHPWAGGRWYAFPMAQPDYLVCMECESPVYVFEWEGGRITEIICPVCGNDDPVNFVTEDELEAMSSLRGGETEE